MRFDELFKALHTDGVYYVLVGGLAGNLHGVDRATFDVDIVLAMDDANLARFVDMAKRLNLIPNIPVPLDALKSAALIDQWHREKGMIVFSFRSGDTDSNVIDVLVKPVVPFDELVKDATTAGYMGQTVFIASKQHLIRLKQGTGRAKDQQDIAMLSAMIAKELGDE